MERGKRIKRPNVLLHEETEKSAVTALHPGPVGCTYGRYADR